MRAASTRRVRTRPSRTIAAATLVACGLTLSAACGGRTPLIAPERASASASEDAQAGVGDARRPDANIAARCATALPVLGEGDPGNVVLEIMLDGSGSMDSDSKWEAATLALEAIFTEMASAPSPGLSVGLTIFEDRNDPTVGSGPYPSSEDVDPRVVDDAQLQRLRNRLEATSPFGGTPTLIALQGTYSFLHDYQPPAPALANPQRVLVVMSDGVPNGGESEQNACIELVRSEYSRTDRPVRTFSIGIGPFPGSAFSYDPGFMSEIAVAGGTATSPPCNPRATRVDDVCHFQITPGGRNSHDIAQDFIDALRMIRGELAPTCVFDLVGPVEKLDLAATNVVWVHGDGGRTQIARDARDGWTYEPQGLPQRIVIHGRTCDTILADKTSHVEVDLVCPPR